MKSQKELHRPAIYLFFVQPGSVSHFIASPGELGWKQFRTHHLKRNIKSGRDWEGCTLNSVQIKK